MIRSGDRGSGNHLAGDAPHGARPLRARLLFNSAGLRSAGADDQYCGGIGGLERPAKRLCPLYFTDAGDIYCSGSPALRRPADRLGIVSAP
jgi:hypothetical protein